MSFSNTDAQHIATLTRFLLRIPHPYTHEVPTSDDAYAAAIYLNMRAGRTSVGGVSVTEITLHWPLAAGEDMKSIMKEHS